MRTKTTSSTPWYINILLMAKVALIGFILFQVGKCSHEIARFTHFQHAVDSCYYINDIANGGNGDIRPCIAFEDTLKSMVNHVR